MEMLLRKGAQINSLNNGGCSSLHVAVNKQHLECAKILLRYKCNVNIQVSLACTISVVLSDDFYNLIISSN